MTWRDQLRPASFRGVPFQVRLADLRGGRSEVVHEYPQRDRPYVEDTGREPRTFRVTAYVLGDDYLDQRDRLVEVLERPPAGFPFDAGGPLVLPTWGLLRAHARSYRVTEETRSGRMATIELEFTETEDPPTEQPALERVAPGPAADELAAAASDAAGGVVEAGLTVAGVVQSVRDATRAALDAAAAAVSSLNVLRGPIADLEALQDQVEGLASAAAELATSPVELVVALRNTIDTVFDAAADVRGALTAYQTLFDVVDVDLAPGSGAAATAANANAVLVRDLTRSLALSGALRASARVPGSRARTRWRPVRRSRPGSTRYSRSSTVARSGRS